MGTFMRNLEIEIDMSERVALKLNWFTFELLLLW